MLLGDEVEDLRRTVVGGRGSKRQPFTWDRDGEREWATGYTSKTVGQDIKAPNWEQNKTRTVYTSWPFSHHHRFIITITVSTFSEVSCEGWSAQLTISFLPQIAISTQVKTFNQALFCHITTLSSLWLIANSMQELIGQSFFLLVFFKQFLSPESWISVGLSSPYQAGQNRMATMYHEFSIVIWCIEISYTDFFRSGFENHGSLFLQL